MDVFHLTRPSRFQELIEELFTLYHNAPDNGSHRKFVAGCSFYETENAARGCKVDMMVLFEGTVEDLFAVKEFLDSRR